MEIVQPKLRFPEFKGDWGNYTLEQLTVKIGDGLHGTPQYVENSDVYFINGNNLIDGKIVINENSKKVSVETLNKNNKGLDENSILISINGTIGSISRYNNEKIMLGKSVGYLNFKQSKDFYFQILQSNKIQDYFISELTGSTIKNLSLKTLRETIIYQPSLEEQTKIANFLSTVDEKLNLLKEKKALLEDYKKGIMQKIFNQEIRFKDGNGNDFEDWQFKTLGQVSIKESSNISANKIEDNSGDFIIYGASGVLKKVDFYLQENDYISIIKDGAGVGRIFYCEGKTSVLGTMEMIKPIEGINTYFLYCLLNNIDFTAFITGSTIPHIYFKDYSKVKCGIPCYDEQTKIANFLSAIDEKIELVSNQIQDTQEYKKGLLQQMFV